MIDWLCSFTNPYGSLSLSGQEEREREKTRVFTDGGRHQTSKQEGVSSGQVEVTPVDNYKEKGGEGKKSKRYY